MEQEATYKVKVQVGDASVEIEGPKEGAVELLKSLTAILQGRGSKAAPGKALEVEPPAAPRESVTGTGRPPDIRSFFEEKQPKSDIEAAAATAFFYQYIVNEDQRKDSISADTLAEAFRLAKRKLPTAISQTLRNAKNAGYFDSAGETGHYKLNPVGYNLVEHTLGKESGDGRKVPKKKGKARGRTRAKSKAKPRSRDPDVGRR